ncbi:RDD family protein [Mycolicibacterium brumae]|uniref:RDD family protein n=1 Tax=Mycolicibacterium brumae TaxID=85968 RepID=A0A2G5PA74_9MYCO|nr:RDD family protein [Mycolicibacterium brumae]MCV7192897.1 RDD family protein [Mycolicibacterium brumae]PIB75258.1 RDD family protein [Mycolicibacterium brumae]RWA23486.1 hypothetical protein MBRU_01295 [Mycolicibacterium brumae DSM 44177]UWW08584.1 RDD family protein [Mycolicibacterium brumae]
MSTGGFDPNLPPQYNAPGGYPPPAGFGAPAGKPGGLGLRFVARLLDGVIVYVVAGILYLPARMAFGDSDVYGMDTSIMVTGMFSGLLTFLYFLVFESQLGWTPGKKVLGLSVRGPNGAAKPTASQAATRNLFTLLPLIPCLGGLLAFIAYIVIAVTISSSPTKQGKHDQLAGGTQVLESS